MGTYRRLAKEACRFGREACAWILALAALVFVDMPSVSMMGRTGNKALPQAAAAKGQAAQPARTVVMPQGVKRIAHLPPIFGANVVCDEGVTISKGCVQ